MKKKLINILVASLKLQKNEQKTGLNDIDDRSRNEVVVTNIAEYISTTEEELPSSWLKIKNFTIKRLNKSYPKYRDYDYKDEQSHVVGEEFTVYCDNKFKIKVGTKLYTPRFVKSLKPYFKVDKITIINRQKFE